MNNAPLPDNNWSYDLEQSIKAAQFCDRRKECAGCSVATFACLIIFFKFIINN